MIQMLNNIEYKDYRKQEDIHGTTLYPAVMVAPVQKSILNDIIASDEIISVFDPFHGSGTALYEAIELKPEIHIVGCDINPLANLITKVKLQGVNKCINRDIDVVEDYINNYDEIYEYNFPNINKWLRSDIINSLALLRTAIMKTNNNRNRLFFWYILNNVIRFNSNTRSSTYKLHIKDSNTIDNIQNKVIDDFLLSARKHYNKFFHKSNNFVLYKNDILDIIDSFDDDLYDISITSPPYGENATTVPYGQFSMLSLYTIPSYDLELEGWELDNYSKIDNNSMGGRDRLFSLDKYEKNLLKEYLDKISISKHKKIIRFFTDYFYFLRELCRITKKYIVLTLGNRTVDRVEIDLVSITKKYLRKYGFSRVSTAMRAIPRKRTPKLTSNVYQTPVNSMNYEYILIYKKTKK
jgi:site-specific DNA-methyltransferase (cytosine-N4-specific)